MWDEMGYILPKGPPGMKIGCLLPVARFQSICMGFRENKNNSKIKTMSDEKQQMFIIHFTKCPAVCCSHSIFLRLFKS